MGRKRARVAFFVGCVADAMFRHTHWATLRVLQQNGCDVFIPPEQGCCGAIHFHAGDSRGARRMADANLVAFELDRYDAIVVNHGGCGAMMKEYGLHWRDGLQPHREKFAAKVKDVNEFLDALGMVPPQRPHRGRGHLPRRLPPGPRPGHHGRPAAAAGQDSRPGTARPARVGHLLRLGRHLQPQRGRHVRPAGPAEDREHSQHRRQIVLAANAGCLLQIQREVRQRKLAAAGDAPDGPARPELPRRTAGVGARGENSRRTGVRRNGRSMIRFLARGSLRSGRFRTASE